MKQILSTRALDKGTVRYAQSYGLSITCIDFIEIREVAFDGNISYSDFDALIFTSNNAVTSFFHNAGSANIIKGKKVFSLSGRTNEELVKRGITPDLTEENAEKLSILIVERAEVKNVLHVCGNIKLDILERELTAHAIGYTSLIAYNTELNNIVVPEEFEAIMFFSPSAVEAFFNANKLNEGNVFFCIGDTTAKALLRKNPNLKIHIPEQISVESMLEQVIEYYREPIYNK